MNRPPGRGVVERMMYSGSNYHFLLIGDVVGAGVFLAMGVRLFNGSPLGAVASVVVGFLAWSGVEYGVRRWILHGPPSMARRAHARHHVDAAAFISAPAFMAAGLACATWAILSVALTASVAAFGVFGLYAGYNYYALLHHLQHRRGALAAWIPGLARLERAHRIHHAEYIVNYGVTTSLWDHLLGSYQPTGDQRRSPNNRTTRVA